ncbi:MAG: ATP-NAD kinase family protein [Promethearchaeota archaeon]
MQNEYEEEVKIVNNKEKFKIGFIINPIAGMGGSVGLKGTDGQQILKKAIKLGAKPQAEERAKLFLEHLIPIKNKIIFIAPPGIMGGDLLNNFGFNVIILDEKLFNHKIELYNTNSNDTKISAKTFLEKNCDIICFVGGDGTARNILEVVDRNIPCLGIPGGVKIHSSVFAINPIMAAQLLMQFLWHEAPLRESEVMDIDEDAFRDNRLSAKLFGYMLTPYSPLYTQPAKMASYISEDEESNKERIAKWIIEKMDPNTIYIIGPGTTTKPIADLLNQKKTLLGVDIMINKRIVKFDVNEKEILDFFKKKRQNLQEITKKEVKEKSKEEKSSQKTNISSENEFRVKIIVTPIGQQGFIFGRGNLQISPKVIRMVGLRNIMIICTKYKLKTLNSEKLRVDTRDPSLDEEMRGFYKVLVDYGEFRILELE